MLPENPSCRPPPGKVYLTIGQDLFAVADYLETAYNASLHAYLGTSKVHPRQDDTFVPRRSSVFPAAFMGYSDLETLAGLDAPTDYGSGIEYADGLSQLVGGDDLHSSKSIAPVGLQLGLWLGGTIGCQAIVNGTWNGQITKLVSYVSQAPFFRVFLRIGYEFDNPSFGYSDSPTMYRQAWRIIVQACRQDNACRSKALFVWHSWGAGLMGDLQLNDFYPGDDVVDWVGLSIFQQVYQKGGNRESHSIWSGGSYSTLLPVLEFAQNRQKPVMIAESTPFGWGISYHDNVWERWFAPVLELLGDYRDVVGMWCYIDCNWEAQPMWHGVGFGDTRIHRNLTVETLWRRHVSDKMLGYGSLSTYCSGGSDATRNPLVVTAAMVPPPSFGTWYHKFAGHGGPQLDVLGAISAFLVAVLVLAQRRARENRRASYEIVN